MAVLTMVAANALGGKSKVTDFIISNMPKNTQNVKKASAFDSFAAVASDFKPSPTS
ncbi:MAG: hypothetical protein J7L21_00640 [Sulfurimonas sp.]|nr:hypothetical protein [Sulfurimonas sp.]